MEGPNDRGSGPLARWRPGAWVEGYITTITAPVEIPPSQLILTLRPGRRVNAEVGLHLKIRAETSVAQHRESQGIDGKVHNCSKSLYPGAV